MNTIQKNFNVVFNGNKNFITPSVINYTRGLNYDIELSRGYGIGRSLLYGVTVIDTHKMEHDHEMSKSFTCYAKASRYIKELVK